MTKIFNSTLLLLAISVSPVFAVVLEDFEAGYVGPGTLITDPADAGNTALHLVSNRGVSNTAADVFAIDTNGFVGKITMDIYDFGATTWDGPLNPPFPANGGTDHGPRWGIQGDANLDGTLDNWAAVGIIQKPFLDANQGYTYVADDIASDGQRAVSFNGDWFTVNFFGNPRRAKTDPAGLLPIPGDGLQLIGNGTIESPQLAGSGAWTTWEFDIDALGNVSITAKEGLAGKFLDAPYSDDVQTQYSPSGAPIENMAVTNMKQIWVTGGQSDLDSVGFLGSRLGAHGILVDNVTFDGVTVVQLPGDANNDGTVDLLDLDILGTNFGLTPATFAQGDFNGDNVVDLLDLDILGTNFGNTASSSAAVPEPGSLALLALVALGLAGRRGTKVA